MALIDKASLLMVPSTYEAGKLYNVLPSGNRAPDSTDQNSGYDQTRADFDFDRGSNAAATRIGSDGLIEKYRENVFTFSNDFSNSAWNLKAGTFTQGVEDPNGGSTAWAWTAQNTDPYIYQQLSVSGVYTLSIYAKGVGSTIGANFQLRNAGLTPNFTLTNEWQRFEIYNIPSNTNLGFEFGNPAVVGDVVHIYSAQLESGLVATEYLNSTSVTAKAGVLVDLPRINYDANGENGSLLLEPSRQNLVPFSEYIASWIKNGNGTGSTPIINTNSAISPEGLNNASRVDLNLNGGLGSLDWSWVYQNFTTSGNNETFSFYIKALDSSNVGKVITFGHVSYDSYTLTSDWVRIETTASAAAANYPYGFRLRGSASTSDTASFYVYGFQMEAGSYSTSYIPNHGTSGGVTRAADSCLGAGDVNTFNSSEGVLFWEGSILSNTTIAGAIALIGAGSSNRVQLYNLGTSLVALIQVGGSIVFQASTVGTIDITTNHKYAVKWALNDFALWVDGVAISTDTSGATFPNNTLTQLRFSDFGANYLYANTKQAITFNEALSDSELATLTTL